MVFSGYMPKSEIASSYGSSLLIFHKGCTILYSYQQYISVPISFHPHQHIIFCSFYSGLPTGYELPTRYLMVLIWVCLMTNNAELTILLSSLENCLFKSFPHFLLRLFVSVVVPYIFWISTFIYVRYII